MEDQLDTKSLIAIVDDFKNESKTKRINAIQYLIQVAKNMGDDRVKSELIPFINTDMVDDDEDEFLLVLIEKLNQLLDVVPPQNQALLIPAYEVLSQNYDQEIKKKVLEGLRKLFTNIDAKKNEQLIFNTIKKLSISESFQQKFVLLGLISYLYPYLSSQSQNEVISIYSTCANDQLPMVRKYAATHVKNLINLFPNNHENEIIQIFTKLAKDDQDFTRILLVDALLPLTNQENVNKHRNTILKFTQQFSEDNSWRVRFQICQIFPEVGKSLDKENQKKLLQYFCNFLQDEEAELKAQALQKLDQFCEFMDPESIQLKVVPQLKQLSIDYHDYVRSALAKTVLKLAPIFGKKKSTDIILPLFISLIKDQNSEIRINLFQNMDKLVQVLGVDTLSSSLLPAIKELTEDKKWRNRITVLEHLPFLAKQLKEDFFNQNLVKILINLLKDNFNEVRMTTVKVLGDLVPVYGQKWVETQIFPKILPLQTTQNYLHRQVLTVAIGHISENMDKEGMSKYILPILQTMAKDKVPNVKICTIKVFLQNQLHQKEKDFVKKILQELSNDEDFDVKYTAKEALKQI